MNVNINKSPTNTFDVKERSKPCIKEHKDYIKKKDLLKLKRCQHALYSQNRIFESQRINYLIAKNYVS